ncbi:MAG: hypothetical protein PHX21_12875 [bacterium]|nr:hypothetical protein [bacterium]
MAYLVEVKKVGQELPTTTDGQKIVVHEPFDFRKTVLTGTVFAVVVAIVNKGIKGFRRLNGLSSRKASK